MKRVFASFNVAEVLLYQNLLNQEGIACFTRNDQLSAATGSWSIPNSTPELWIQRDSDEPRSLELLEHWRHAETTPLDPWVCPKCGETNEGQFGACWKCGHEIDG